MNSNCLNSSEQELELFLRKIILDKIYYGALIGTR